MKLALSLAAAGLALAVASSYADTSNSKDKGKMERKASPSAPKSDEERAEASQGQPDVPHSSGGSTAKKAKPKKGPESKKGKPSASAGASVPGPEFALDAVSEQRFRALDIDGDGAISKAEAAGNADLVRGFDRADRKPRDGKLSRAEYDSVGKVKATKQQAAR
jgi:hypothetical protein